jgi:hypothetical protein
MAMMLHSSTPRDIRQEIDITNAEIKLALWSVPANIDLARTLISKRMGLRILAGERCVNLKPPISEAAA